MVRASRWGLARTTSFPHTRGDGPSWVDASSERIWFSPHTWGWSGHHVRFGACSFVFPTPVGMVRTKWKLTALSKRFPHTRGDGPRENAREWQEFRFSPHPWGWSARCGGGNILPSVFPTHVGMVRTLTGPTPRSRSFPHTRGDGPCGAMPGLSTTQFSPHPWGWSVPMRVVQRQTQVFPTPVGMVRRSLRRYVLRMSFPHTREDGPFAVRSGYWEYWFSPHPWGCSLSTRSKTVLLALGEL